MIGIHHELVNLQLVVTLLFVLTRVLESDSDDDEKKDINKYLIILVKFCGGDEF